jgi:hypothetical protein
MQEDNDLHSHRRENIKSSTTMLQVPLLHRTLSQINAVRILTSCFKTYLRIIL